MAARTRRPFGLTPKDFVNLFRRQASLLYEKGAQTIAGLPLQLKTLANSGRADVSVLTSKLSETRDL
jgi:hypothetical protein